MNQIKQEFVTKEGLGRLEEEHKDLTSRRRREVAQRIKEAKEFGDLSENSEYEEAKNEQAFVEGRIAELENMIKNAVLIEENHKKREKVVVGAKVTVGVNGGSEEFTIVGSQEANPLENKISNVSPIGKALLDKKVGDEVEVETPVGKKKYIVKKIS